MWCLPRHALRPSPSSAMCRPTLALRRSTCSASGACVYLPACLPWPGLAITLHSVVPAKSTNAHFSVSQVTEWRRQAVPTSHASLTAPVKHSQGRTFQKEGPASLSPLYFPLSFSSPSSFTCGTAGPPSSPHSTTLMYLSALVLAMLGLSYASVPLYRMFCQATGFGGTVKRREVCSPPPSKSAFET